MSALAQPQMPHGLEGMLVSDYSKCKAVFSFIVLLLVCVMVFNINIILMYLYFSPKVVSVRQ